MSTLTPALTLASIADIFTNAWPYIFGPIGALLALAMAYYFSRSVMAQSEGEPNMVEIASSYGLVLPHPHSGQPCSSLPCKSY